MSYDYIELGSAPCDETCAALVDDDYEERSKIECKVYKHQLQRTFPIPPHLDGLVYFSIKRFEHDFGFYREVVIKFDEESEAACDFAYKIDGNTPLSWDDTAKAELKTTNLLVT